MPIRACNSLRLVLLYKQRRIFDEKISVFPIGKHLFIQKLKIDLEEDHYV